MKIEQQVVSLELAKKLKELGVKQESLFGHYRIGELYGIKTDRPIVTNEHSEWWSAFTVSEIGELLPRYIVHGDFTHELKIIRSSVWRFYYGDKIYLTAGTADNEADARAQMLIYLLENGLMTV